MHIIRDHIADMMIFLGELTGWGYGYHNCNSGEHLNKIIKQMEIDNSNLSHDRFFQIMKTLRVKQLHYPSSIFAEKKLIKCSRCDQYGHNRKNKSCPLHTSQPEPYFSDSDPEDS